MSRDPLPGAGPDGPGPDGSPQPPPDGPRGRLGTTSAGTVVGFFLAYLLWHAFRGSAGTYLEVFRIAGVAAFMTYGLGLIPFNIWYRSPRMWSTLLDALIYAGVTAGSFGWLWHQP